MSQIAYGSAGSSLDDKSATPYLLRTVPSGSISAKVGREQPPLYYGITLVTACDAFFCAGLLGSEEGCLCWFPVSAVNNSVWIVIIDFIFNLFGMKS